jgi:hypothetical protein
MNNASYRVTWSNRTRADLTFSLPREDETRYACEHATRAIESTGAGWTSREGYGGWQGECELSVTLSIIGDGWRDAIDAAARELFAAGCVALQLETWTPDYRCAELQAPLNPSDD